MSDDERNNVVCGEDFDRLLAQVARPARVIPAMVAVMSGPRLIEMPNPATKDPRPSIVDLGASGDDDEPDVFDFDPNDF